MTLLVFLENLGQQPQRDVIGPHSIAERNHARTSPKSCRRVPKSSANWKSAFRTSATIDPGERRDFTIPLSAGSAGRRHLCRPGECRRHDAADRQRIDANPNRTGNAVVKQGLTAKFAKIRRSTIAVLHAAIRLVYSHECRRPDRPRGRRIAT